MEDMDGEHDMEVCVNVENVCSMCVGCAGDCTT
jgi:hypothetical protein